MIDYSKLATVLVRLAGVWMLAIGVMNLALAGSAYAVGGLAAAGPFPVEGFAGALFHVVASYLLLRLSRRIGGLLARGLS